MSDIRRLFWLCLLFAVAPTVLRAQPRYDIQLLPDTAFAINDFGQVGLTVPQWKDGYGGTYSSMEIWDNGATTQLGITLEPQAYDINNAGQIVGHYMQGCNPVACVWSASGRTDIAVGETANAVSINEAGYVVGTYGATYDSRRAFVWDGTSMSYLTTDGAVNSEGYSINNLNQVTGSTTYYSDSEGYSNYQTHMILWSAGQPVFLENQGFTAFCGEINDSTQIIGRQWGNGGPATSVLWSNGQMIALGGPAGLIDAHALNNRGQVVGHTVSNNRACLWDNGAFLDLNGVLPAGSPYVLHDAQDINDRGQILAWGSVAGLPGYDPTYSCFVLTPVPEPSGLPTLCCGIGLALAHRRRRTRQG